ncbi:MAG: metallophosphoesterase family protein [Polyangiaceae bacterium]|nr:metallophosphoesterase family protein [Polyangiaceae bacterium]
MRRLASLAPLLIVAFAAQGCGSSSSDPSPAPSGGAGAGGAGGAGGATGATRPLSPSTCAYDTTPRMEYTDVFAPKSDAELAKQALGAAPQPKRVRLGLGGAVAPGAAGRVDASRTIAIAWETDLETTATTVELGTSPDPAAWTTRVDGFSYVVPEGKAAIGGSDLRMHEAHVCGLEPKTTYYYRVGGGPPGKEVWSDVIPFHTLTTSADDKVVIAATGDSRGENKNAWQILQGRLAKRGDIDVQLFSGDMIDLATDQGAYGKWLDSATTGVDGAPSTLGRMLLLQAMGNHEAYSSPFFATVVQPQDPAAQGKFSELFFSLEVGPAHVIVLDDFAIGSATAMPGYREQALAWLKADLDAAVKDRAAHPWILAVHHHGEWTSSNHADDKAVLEVRKALTPLWDEAGVDLVLDGHDHNYERSKKLKLGADGKPVIGAGTSYVVCAGSGADGYGTGTSAWTDKTFDYSKGPAIGVYAVLTIERSKLSLEARALTPAGDDPVVDQLELTK